MMPSAKPTFKRVALPSVMLVGMHGSLVEAIRARMTPIPVIHVAHLAAAGERILVTRPIVVVVAHLGLSDELDHFRELSRGCGSALFQLSELGAPEDVPRRVNQLVMTLGPRRTRQRPITETQPRSWRPA